MESFEGGCGCHALRYRLGSPPLFVHCCHWCQRETGSAFVINALIEADRVTLAASPTSCLKHAPPGRDGPGLPRAIHSLEAVLRAARRRSPS